MSRVSNDTTSRIIDGLLKLVASGGYITTALLAPGAIQAIDKPLSKALDKLDKRAQERELRRIVYYMKSRGLISYTAHDYEHGIKITRSGQARLKQSGFSSLAVPPPKKWDGKWRIVFFDIPVEENRKRDLLSSKLRSLGFQKLQMSIWIYPFDCRREIEAVSTYLGIAKYMTYIETSHIDAEDKLRKRFKTLLIVYRGTGKS